MLRNYLKVWVISLALVVLALLAGCTAEQYGAGVNQKVPKVEVKTILLDPSYHGRTVNLQGRITTQCASEGCWLFLDDGTGQVMVNMSPRGFSVPPKYGKKATVTGQVYQSLDGVMLIAEGVEVR